MASADDTKKEKETNDKKPQTNDEDKKTNKIRGDMEKIKDEFVQLGRDLSMDVSTSDEAWASYDAIKQKYTLEVSCIRFVNKLMIK